MKIKYCYYLKEGDEVKTVDSEDFFYKNFRCKCRLLKKKKLSQKVILARESEV